MNTRRRFIAPWNPWQNVSETGWRIILRPLRILLAMSNVSRRLWPFAVSQIVRVHNALSSQSSSVGDTTTSTALVRAFLASLSASSLPPPSPYHLVTGKEYDAKHIRVMFCEVEVRVRSHDDLRARDKTQPVTI